MAKQSSGPFSTDFITAVKASEKLSAGKRILFTGNKRKTKKLAEALAAELGREIYRVDLARVFSKFIGETEKNLNRIFKDAKSANSILFFDEADALFAKRSEVKDAHDRYANIEIDYVLLRLEEYKGIAILATKIKENIDKAFLRRGLFVVDPC